MSKSRKKFIVMCGPPAAGKSTYIASLIRKHGEDEVRVISPDDFVYNDAGVYDWSPSRARGAWEQAYAALPEAVADEPTIIVWDSTMTKAKGRRDILRRINQADKKDKYVKVLALTPVCDVEELLRRNSARSADRQVPDQTIAGMKASLEKNPPNYQEGWDDIVQLDSSGFDPRFNK